MRNSIIEIIRRYCGDEATEQVVKNRIKHEEFFGNLPHAPGEKIHIPDELELIDIHMIMSVARDYIQGEPLYRLISDIGIDCLDYDQRNIAREVFSFLIELPETPLPVRLDVLLQRADMLLKYNEWEKSLGDLNKALSMASDLKKTKQLSRAHNLLAIWHFENGDIQTGLNHLNEALSFSEKADDTQSRQIITLHLAIFNHMIGELEKARNYCSQAEKSENPLFLAKLLHISSIISRDLGEYNQGFIEASEAIEKALSIGNSYQEACIRLTRSEIQILLGRNEDAREDLQTAFKTFNKEGDKLGVSDAYRIFGLYNIAKKDFKLASANLNISLDISKSYNNIHSVGEIYIAKALLSQEMGDRAALGANLENARNFFGKIGAGKRVDLEMKKWQINF